MVFMADAFHIIFFRGILPDFSHAITFFSVHWGLEKFEYRVENKGMGRLR